MRLRNRVRPAGWFAALFLAGSVALASAATAPSPAAAERVRVDWTNPGDFAEAKENPGFGIGRQTPEEWLPELAKHLQTRADRVLPAGERLAVTFTNVKRAGTYEPWRGPQWDDVRIVKDIYPPRISLHFTLTSANGATLSEGDRSLRDPAFLSRGLLYAQDDPLRFEKRLLDDWLRREFPDVRDARS